MRRVTRIIAFALALVALVVVYHWAQSAVEERIRYWHDRYSALRAVSAAQRSGQFGGDATRAAHESIMALGEFTHLSANIANGLLPVGLGVGLGVWAALLMRSVASRRGRAPRPGSAPRRTWGLSVPHFIGLAAWLVGLMGIAVIAAHRNGSWRRFGDLPPGAVAGAPTAWTLAKLALPAGGASIGVVLGAIALLAAAPARPFTRLSRARALSLGLVGLGGACVLFSMASTAMVLRRTGPSRPAYLDPTRDWVFEAMIGSASLTRAALPVGIALGVAGLLASVIIPRLMRRRMSLVGSTECVDCAHPLIGGQSVCPECGADHTQGRPSAP